MLAQICPWPGKLLLFCLGRCCCWCCFSCVASLQSHVLCHAELLWVPDLGIWPHTFILRVFSCGVSAGYSSALLCAEQAVLQFSAFKSTYEHARDGEWDGGNALRTLSSHQKSSDPDDLDWSDSAIFTLLGLASVALFSGIAQLLFCSF